MADVTRPKEDEYIVAFELVWGFEPSPELRSTFEENSPEEQATIIGQLLSDYEAITTATAEGRDLASEIDWDSDADEPHNRSLAIVQSFWSATKIQAAMREARRTKRMR